MQGSKKIAFGKLSGISARLMLGTALTGMAALLATSASAQNEVVTVTGTSIRGQQPVGANVISVDRAAIEATGAQTTAQLLVTIPQLDSFGAAAQGGQNSSDATTQAPTIHSLGNSASSSTLILIDGHRLPITGIRHNLIDPSLIPPAAIQNVEVLPDGASAIYGSDAVAGVINFHTRKDYSGWETSVQAGIADHYSSFDFSQLFGHNWDTGGIVAVYNYSSRSNLMNVNRSFITARQDIRRGAADPNSFGGYCNPVGGTPPGPTSNAAGTVTNCVPIPNGALAAGTAGTYAGLQTVTLGGPGIAGGVPGGLPVPYPSDGGNFQNFACPVATIATSSNAATGTFAYPYTNPIIPRQTTPTGGPGTGVCDTGNLATSLPSEVRNQGLVSIRQSLNDKLSLTADIVYASRMDSDRNAVGSVTNAAAFSPLVGTGGPAFGTNQANPFYVTVPGATGAQRNSEFITMDFSQLLADRGISPGFASTKTSEGTIFTALGLDYDLGGDWLLSLGAVLGADLTTVRNNGGLSSPEALLALHGTTNTAGTGATGPASSVIVDPYGLGTVLGVTRALNTSNALDVWNPSATNRTSTAVLRSLVDASSMQTSYQGMNDVTIHADGPLGDFWGAGQAKAAIGAEWTLETNDWRNTATTNGGPASTSSGFFKASTTRSIYAVYAEFVLPLVGPDMNVPLMQKLTLDVAGRYDHYNDFGETRNPKIALSWDIIDGIRASGSFGTSFTAPQTSSVGAPITNLIPGASVSSGGASNGLVVLFNDTRPFNGGAGIAGTFVANPYACAAAGSQPVTDATGATNATKTGAIWDTTGATAAAGCKINNVAGATEGLSIFTGNPDLKPSLGQSYSANLVFDDFGKFWDVLEGLSTQVTYYQAKLTGANTNIGVGTTQTNAGLPFLTAFGPNNGCVDVATCAANAPGWAQSAPTVQQFLIRAPLTAVLPPTIYALQQNTIQNAFDLWQGGLDFSINYRMQTDTLGSFSFGLNGNYILRASQRNAGNPLVFDTKDGRNGGRFANIELTGRANIGWHLDPFSVGFSINYQHPYNAGRTTFPFNLPGPGRLANQQHITAQMTYDMNASYDLPSDMFGGLTSGTSLNVSVSNLLDTNPPYADTSSGQAGGSAIGRQVNIGIRKKW